jgi:hypothetical protein
LKREKKKKVKGIRNIYYKIAKNYPNLENETPIQVREASTTPNTLPK